MVFKPMKCLEILAPQTVMLGIQILCEVTLRRHFISVLYPEDEGIGSLPTRHIT